MSNELVPMPASAINAFNFDPATMLLEVKLDVRNPKHQLVISVCQKYGLDPLLKHILLIGETLYVTRDGLLHIAHASGAFDGLEVEYVGLDDERKHHVAYCSVYRRGMSRPFRMRGRYPVSGRLSAAYGPEMAEKVATCRALRMAFDISLCSREEAWDKEDEEYVLNPAQPDPKSLDVRPVNAIASPVQITATELPTKPITRTVPVRDAFDTEARRLGVTFSDKTPRGVWANRCLNRPDDYSSDGITPDDWLVARDALESVFHARRVLVDARVKYAERAKELGYPVVDQNGKFIESAIIGTYLEQTGGAFNNTTASELNRAAELLKPYRTPRQEPVTQTAPAVQPFVPTQTVKPLRRTTPDPVIDTNSDLDGFDDPFATPEPTIRKTPMEQGA